MRIWTYIKYTVSVCGKEENICVGVRIKYVPT